MQSYMGKELKTWDTHNTHSSFIALHDTALAHNL